MFTQTITTLTAFTDNNGQAVTVNGKPVRIDLSKEIDAERCQDLLIKSRNALNDPSIDQIVIAVNSYTWDMSEQEFNQDDLMDLHDSGCRPVAHTSKTYTYYADGDLIEV